MSEINILSGKKGDEVKIGNNIIILQNTYNLITDDDSNDKYYEIETNNKIKFKINEPYLLFEKENVGSVGKELIIKKILLTDKKSQIYFIKDQHNSWYKILQKRWKKRDSIKEIHLMENQ